MLTTNQNKADRLVRVQVLRPFRVVEGTNARVAKADKVDETGKVVDQGEDVEIPLWLANMLANHHPPKIGPVTDLGRSAQRRAA